MKDVGRRAKLPEGMRPMSRAESKAFFSRLARLARIDALSGELAELATAEHGFEVDALALEALRLVRSHGDDEGRAELVSVCRAVIDRNTSRAAKSGGAASWMARRAEAVRLLQSTESAAEAHEVLSAFSHHWGDGRATIGDLQAAMDRAASYGKRQDRALLAAWGLPKAKIDALLRRAASGRKR